SCRGAHCRRPGRVVQRRGSPAHAGSGVPARSCMRPMFDLLTLIASALLAASTGIFTVYCLDELALLVCYAMWYVRLGRASKRRPLSAALLRSEPQRRLAVPP